MENAAAWNGMPLRFSCLRSDGAALKESGRKILSRNFVQGDKIELRAWNPPKGEGGYAIMKLIYGMSDVGAV